MGSRSVTERTNKMPDGAHPMQNLAMATDMVPGVKRIYRQLKKLNSAYMDAEDKRETVAVLQAHVSELKVVHSLLPSGLREKSWVLSIERHVA
jgi:hypothetical protein